MMSWFQLGIADFTLLGAIGGVSAIIGGWFSRYFFPKLLQDRRHTLEDRSETHRFRLKRQELLFDRELVAVEKLFVLHETAFGIQAGPYDDDPDFWGSTIAPSLGEWDEVLTRFIKNHGTVLSDETLAHIHGARTAARLGFTSYCEDIAPSGEVPDYSPGATTIKYMKEFASELFDARRQSRTDLAIGSLGRESAQTN